MRVSGAIHACYVNDVRSEIEQAIEPLKSGEPESTEKALRLSQETVFSFSNEGLPAT